MTTITYFILSISFSLSIISAIARIFTLPAIFTEAESDPKKMKMHKDKSDADINLAIKSKRQPEYDKH